MAVSYKTSNASPKVVIHSDSNTGTVVVAGNSTTSNITSFAEEEVHSASISQVIWGTTSTEYWTLKRGANLVGIYSGTGHINYAAYGILLEVDSTADLSANLVGGVNGTIMIELKKS
jgi:hypothetical protein